MTAAPQRLTVWYQPEEPEEAEETAEAVAPAVAGQLEWTAEHTLQLIIALPAFREFLADAVAYANAQEQVQVQVPPPPDGNRFGLYGYSLGRSEPAFFEHLAQTLTGIYRLTFQPETPGQPSPFRLGLLAELKAALAAPAASPAVSEILQALAVDLTVPPKLLTAWADIVDRGQPIAQRQSRVAELARVLQAVQDKEVRDLLWEWQRRLVRENL